MNVLCEQSTLIAQNSLDRFICHDSRNRLESFSTSDIFCTFRSQHLVSMYSKDSTVVYNSENNKIYLKSNVDNNVVEFGYNKYIYLKHIDSVLILDSAKFNKPQASNEEISQTVFNFSFGAIEIDLSYQCSMPNNAVVSIDKKKYTIELYPNSKAGYIKSIIADDSAYYFRLGFQYHNPESIIYYSRTDSVGVLFSTNLRNNKIKFIEAIKSENYIMDGVLYEYNCMGRVRKRKSIGNINYCN